MENLIESNNNSAKIGKKKPISNLLEATPQDIQRDEMIQFTDNVCTTPKSYTGIYVQKQNLHSLAIYALFHSSPHFLSLSI